MGSKKEVIRMNERRLKHHNHSSRDAKNTRVKVKVRKPRKRTVGITLPSNLVERARIHKLNISRITEQALTSILDYLETQNRETITTESSNFLSRGSFLKESRVPRAGFEPATTRSSAGRSPRLSYLGHQIKRGRNRFKVF